MSLRDLRRPEVLALGGLAAAGALSVVSVLWAHRVPPPVAISSPPAATMISVHVVGEVVWPGLYVLKAGSRVQDAVFAAHGPTLIADLKKVNLAAVLRDGDRVVIPRIAQPPYPYAEAMAAERQAMAAARAARPSGAQTAPEVQARRRVNPAAQQGAQGAAGETAVTVNVNTATAEDLERLPGVGPVLARRIVEFREARGLFRRLEDLQQVQGIGPRLYRRVEPFVRLDDGTP
ncbi:MAG: ComEA family DNA-binding protein [Armatimonadota bacterium]|nr:ComEA family DNA-binding protein [Armatimonadota bacterium]